MGQIILVGTDGSSGSDRAIDFAIERARMTGEPMLIAYVIEWSPYSFNTPEENEERHSRREQELEKARREVIDPVLQRVRDAGVSVEGKATHGHPAESLLQMAQQRNASMIVVGRRGQSRSRIASLLFGSVSGSLVQISDRPVTMVP